MGVKNYLVRMIKLTLASQEHFRKEDFYLRGIMMCYVHKTIHILGSTISAVGIIDVVGHATQKYYVNNFYCYTVLPTLLWSVVSVNYWTSINAIIDYDLSVIGEIYGA